MSQISPLFLRNGVRSRSGLTPLESVRSNCAQYSSLPLGSSIEYDCKRKHRSRSLTGLTLIEVLVAITIASILTIGIERLLDVALTSWRFGLEEVAISKLSEETLRRMMEGDYELSGIRDAVEMVETKPDSIAFVPLWTDVFDQVPKEGKFYLSKQIRSGAQPPIGEIMFKNEVGFKTYPTTIHSGSGAPWVTFGFPVKQDSTVQLSYHPDVRLNPEVLMRYQWQKEKGQILRSYNNEITDFNLRKNPVQVTSVHFTYCDGYNRAIEIEKMKPADQLNVLRQISAVKIDLTFHGKELTRSTTSFVNIRALGKTGLGVILDQGLSVPIPDSKTIRVLRLINFTGIKDGQVIELKVASSASDRTWRLKLYLGSEEESPILRRYEVFYPSDKLVLTNTPDTSLSSGFDLLNMGGDGLYDYDDDDGVHDEVSFSGDQITLTVEKMDASGVMLVVRP